MRSMTSRLAAATMLAGVGTVAMAGAANASTSYDCESSSHHGSTAIAGPRDAHPGLLTGVGGLLGGVAAGLGDITTPVLDGLI